MARREPARHAPSLLIPVHYVAAVTVWSLLILLPNQQQHSTTHCCASMAARCHSTTRDMLVCAVAAGVVGTPCHGTLALSCPLTAWEFGFVRPLSVWEFGCVPPTFNFGMLQAHTVCDAQSLLSLCVPMHAPGRPHVPQAVIRPLCLEHHTPPLCTCQHCQQHLPLVRCTVSQRV
jgi:hypothetical protein